MEKRNIAVILGLLLGSIIISGLMLNTISYVKIWLMAILALLLLALFYWVFIKKDAISEKYEIVLVVVTLAISLAMVVLSKFPFSDFWWYHEKNWFILHYLLDLGKLTGWVPFWHFGNPLLQMYAPGSHVLVIFFTKIFSINQFYAEIIVNALSYILLILALNMFLTKHTDKKIAFLSSLFVAVSPRLFNEAFIQGHYTNLLSLAFGLIGLSFLESKEKKDKILFTVFIFLSLITHFSFFTIILLSTALAITLLLRFKDYKLLGKFIIPIALAAFWLLPAIIESRYWQGTTEGPSPFIIYLLSFGPFLLLAFYGMYKMHKNKMSYVLAFSISFLIMSLLPVFLFPVLPDGIRNMLQKLFVDTFKSTVTASIFLVVPIVVGLKDIINSKKYRKLGYLLMGLFVAFSLYTDYVYARQDAINVVQFNKEYYKDNSYTQFYLNNYAAIKKTIYGEDVIYNLDPIFGPGLFNVFVASGPPAPAPKRNLGIKREDYLEYLKDNNVRLNVINYKVNQEDYQRVNALGFYTVKEYEISLDYFKKIINDGKLFDYLLKPEKYPSKTEEKEVTIQLAKEHGEFIEDTTNESSLNYDIDGQNIIIYPKNSAKIKIGFNYSPHWKAYADGKRIKIEKNEFDTMELDIPANAKKVELIWKNSAADYIGIVISLAAIALIILYCNSSLGSRHKP